MLLLLCGILFFVIVRVDQAALLSRTTVFKALIPLEVLELKTEVQDEKWVGKVNDRTSFVMILDSFGQVEVVKGIGVSLLNDLKQVLLGENRWNIQDLHGGLF